MTKLVYTSFIIGVLMLYGCSGKGGETGQMEKWKFVREITLEGIAPVGIAAEDHYLWLSDVDNNRIIKTDLSGTIIQAFKGFKRPMHIAIHGGRIYIPEFNSDTITVIESGKISTIPLHEQPDAPGGVGVLKDVLAVADFYNHRVILQQGDQVDIIGKKGHNDGELNYPTDLDIFGDLIYVADAYNNRVEVFDFQGKYVRMIGWNEGIKVATGLKVTPEQVIVADFHGNRVLVYDHDGKLLQIVSQGFDQPTDIAVSGKTMYVTNYAGNFITVFEVHDE